MQIVTFDACDNANAFAALSPEALDDISFGIVQVDATGRIHIFNKSEGEITGRSPKAAIGKNFFDDVAICTNTPDFRGRFDDGVRSGNLNVLFEWFLPGTPRHAVQVHLKAANQADRYWIFTKRL